MSYTNYKLTKSIGTWEVMVAGVALVVAASTLVSDFSGYFAIGGAFVIALVLGFIINLMLGISAADLSVAYPRAGALYNYIREIVGGKVGEFLGIFVGLTFFGMSAFALSGETVAGAFGMQALFKSDAHISIFIVAMGLLAVIPNIFGIKTTAWVSATLLIFMLGLRWFFGIAGFLGFSETGAWSAANLNSGVGLLNWFGDGGILAAGLALAFWSFVGIEFACSLAEEVSEPHKSLPRGLIFGLLVILATSVVMGLGVTGTQPLSVWQSTVSSDLGQSGDAPQLAVGKLMFGDIGLLLMALASISASLGSLTVAFASMPRVIYSIARDGRFFGPLSKLFGQLHPKFGTPVEATVLTFFVFTIPALWSSEVVNWLYSAAYVWILLYVGYHILALINRKKHPNANKAFNGNWVILSASLGIVLTIIGLYYAFAGAHTEFGFRALVLIASALAATFISFFLPKYVEKKSDGSRQKSGLYTEKFLNELDKNIEVEQDEKYQVSL